MPVKITRDDALRTTRYEVAGRLFELRDLRIGEQKRMVSALSKLVNDRYEKLAQATEPKGMLELVSEEFPALISELWAALFRPQEPVPQEWLEEALDNADLIDLAKRIVKDNHLEGFGGLLSSFFQRTFDARAKQAARQAAENP
jgi:hypothetical protein